MKKSEKINEKKQSRKEGKAIQIVRKANNGKIPISVIMSSLFF